MEDEAPVAGYGTAREKRALAAKANSWLVAALLGFVLLPFVVIQVFSQHRVLTASALELPAVLGVGDLLCWVVGCGLYAKSRGHSVVAGVAGLLGPVGFLLLRSRPDLWKEALAPAPSEGGSTNLTNYPR